MDKLAHAWQVFLHYFGIAAPWLVVAGLPSIITALTAYPKADGVVKALKVLLNILSMLTHKDSPGTMKMPLTMSKPPLGMMVQPDRAGEIRLPLLPFLLFASAAGMMLAACPGLTPSQRAYGAAFAACMESKGLSAAPDVGQEAWNDLSAGTDKATIITQLQGLAGRASVDAVTCAVSAWLHPAQPAMQNPVGVEAAKAWLNDHKANSSTIVIPRG